MDKDMIYIVIAVSFLLVGSLVGYFISLGITAHRSKTHQLIWDEETQSMVWKKRIYNSRKVMNAYANLLTAVENRKRYGDSMLDEAAQRAREAMNR